MTRANRTVPRRRFNLTTTFYSLLGPAASTDEIIERHSGTREVLAPTWVDQWLEEIEPEFADRYAVLRQLVDEKSPVTWEKLDGLIQDVLQHLEDSPNTANSAAQRALTMRREKIAEAMCDAVEKLIAIAKSSTLTVQDGHATLVEQVEKRLGGTDSLVIQLSDSELSIVDGDLQGTSDDGLPVLPVRARSTTGSSAPRTVYSGLSDLGVRSLLFAARRGCDAYAATVPTAVQ